MDPLSPTCAAQSAGTSNALFGILLQTIFAAQCAIRPNWPEDFGPQAKNQSKIPESFKFNEK